jgi:acetyl esterase/lipase
LKYFANECQMTIVSVGYRLAPEDPYPAAVHDCFDAAEYLVDHAEQEYGARLLVIGGDSAGGTLSATTAFQLMRSRPTHQLVALVFLYGYFDLTLNLPAASSFTKPLVLSVHDLQFMNENYTPGMSLSDRRNPLISPVYEDMRGLASLVPGKSLPPAIFLCGTEDALLDDSLVMSTKWMIAGGEAVLKIYPGAPHGFVVVPGFALADEAKAHMVQFVREKLRAAV